MQLAEHPLLAAVAAALTLPFDEEVVITIRRRPVAGRPEIASTESPSVLGGTSAPSVSDARPARTLLDPDTPLARARREAAEHPDEARHAAQWARRIGYSQRELARARRAGALPSAPKGDTRGHNALLIAAEDLVAYLECVEEIERGDRPAPAWYAKVRRPRW